MEINRTSGLPAGEPQSLSAIPAASVASQRLVAGVTDRIRGDSVLLRSGLGAALAAELVRLWDGLTAQRPDAAIAYEAARRAGTPEIALIQLERAIKANPGHATVAISDPDFAVFRESVARMIEHLTAAARLEAQAAIREAIDMDPDRRETAAVLNAAEARYQLNTYAGYLEAAIAARLALQIGRERAEAISLSRSSIVDRMQRLMEPLGRIRTRAANGAAVLWERFPLFAILLGWFGAGVGFGVLAGAFGLWPELRWLFGFWGMGLVAIVMLGFLRSLRSKR